MERIPKKELQKRYRDKIISEAQALVNFHLCPTWERAEEDLREELKEEGMFFLPDDLHPPKSEFLDVVWRRPTNKDKLQKTEALATLEKFFKDKQS